MMWEKRWAAGTFREGREAVNSLVIRLEETSKGENDSDDAQVQIGLSVLMVHTSELIHFTVQCSHRLTGVCCIFSTQFYDQSPYNFHKSRIFFKCLM
jgi:hypothetical protein